MHHHLSINQTVYLRRGKNGILKTIVTDFKNGCYYLESDETFPIIMREELLKKIIVQCDDVTEA